MILKRYCIDCGKIEPPEGQKCCPDSRVYWIEKEAAEKLNEMERMRSKTFDELLARLTPRKLSDPDDDLRAMTDINLMHTAYGVWSDYVSCM